MRFGRIVSVLAQIFLVATTAFSANANIDSEYLRENRDACLDHGRPLDIINEQVLNWKETTANAYLARARISGVVDQVYSDHSGHRHFSLKIGTEAQDHIEVIYNLQFGNLPTPSIGDKAEACGDYITSIARTGRYPPSPAGAIIHWVHRSSGHHEPGYVILNGVKYQ